MRLSRFKDSPLHRAVIDDRPDQINQLAQDEDLRFSKNSSGFTALELARFLGRGSCVKLLSPFIEKPKQFKIVPRNYKRILELSTKQFSHTFRLHYRPFIYFPNYKTFKEVLRNCPFILKLFGQKENQLLTEKYSHELSNGHVANTVIQWIDDTMGYGLFANEDFSAETYIGEYTGMVRRLFRLSPDQNAYCFHYPTRFFSWKYFLIDSLRNGNEMRFVNHSSQPNLRPVCIVDRGLLHQVFLTSRPIKSGEQLLFDYGKDYWQHRVVYE